MSENKYLKGLRRAHSVTNADVFQKSFLNIAGFYWYFIEDAIVKRITKINKNMSRRITLLNVPSVFTEIVKNIQYSCSCLYQS